LYKEPSLSFLENENEVGGKRCHDNSNGSDDQYPLKKSKMELFDEKDKYFEPPSGTWQEVTVQLFLQQVMMIFLFQT
jgi:hypothetical protein